MADYTQFPVDQQLENYLTSDAGANKLLSQNLYNQGQFNMGNLNQALSDKNNPLTQYLQQNYDTVTGKTYYKAPAAPANVQATTVPAAPTATNPINTAPLNQLLQQQVAGQGVGVTAQDVNAVMPTVQDIYKLPNQQAQEQLMQQWANQGRTFGGKTQGAQATLAANQQANMANTALNLATSNQQAKQSAVQNAMSMMQQANLQVSAQDFQAKQQEVEQQFTQAQNNAKSGYVDDNGNYIKGTDQFQADYQQAIQKSQMAQQQGQFDEQLQWEKQATQIQNDQQTHIANMQISAQKDLQDAQLGYQKTLNGYVDANGNYVKGINALQQDLQNAFAAGQNAQAQQIQLQIAQMQIDANKYIADQNKAAADNQAWGQGLSGLLTGIGTVAGAAIAKGLL